MDALGQSIVTKLRNLGFTDEEIQYQFTGDWAAQRDRALADSPAGSGNGNNGNNGNGNR